jgi:hypothetical protein
MCAATHEVCKSQNLEGKIFIPSPYPILLPFILLVFLLFSHIFPLNSMKFLTMGGSSPLALPIDLSLVAP